LYTQGKGASVLEMPSIYDIALCQLIRDRLQQDKRTAGMTVDVTSCDGSVCLVGRVDTEAEKEAALFVVQGLTSVRCILDQIAVRQPTIAGAI